ncbi:hypothetical protein BDK51DRAFT_47256 [Blyttiomyces helicus]|uniref:Uncharacterized protein n=1 Tax=Blyttiomyces helicus TaxID=388810 RepID=A0A4V1IQC8_9FUNG|nr:hypothetical protein BDK51DRAFT_47256 [Blyttiomyces helicus]|eukprot:RKO86107.1 hypothetical protein BDK51DRAFT_47256 [Blyttiomyces helicus]
MPTGGGPTAGAASEWLGFGCAPTRWAPDVGRQDAPLATGWAPGVGLVSRGACPRTSPAYLRDSKMVDTSYSFTLEHRSQLQHFRRTQRHHRLPHPCKPQEAKASNVQIETMAQGGVVAKVSLAETVVAVHGKRFGNSQPQATLLVLTKNRVERVGGHDCLVTNPFHQTLPLQIKSHLTQLLSIAVLVEHPNILTSTTGALVHYCHDSGEGPVRTTEGGGPLDAPSPLTGFVRASGPLR